MADPTPTPTPTPTPDPNLKPWFDGKLDAEMVGRLQNRGWADKPADVVAVEALKAHHEAEKMLGIPKDQLVRKPNPQDEASTKVFWQQFGVPVKADEYKFTSLLDKDGKVTNAALDKAVRDAAFAGNVPADGAARIAEAVVKATAAGDLEREAANKTKLDEGRADLAKNWGTNHAQNMLLAKDGAAKLGLEPEVVAALETTSGYAKTMEALRRIGAMGAEGDHIGGDKNNTNGSLTQEQAVAKLAELKTDNEWTTRYLNGGAVEKREFVRLTTIIAGGDDTEASLNANANRR